MIYTPPAWQEWLCAAAILAAGATCLRLGAWSGHRSVRARNITAAVGIALALGAAAAHYPPLREVAGAWLSIPGGEGVLACFGALTLLGVAGSDHKRRSSRAVPIAAAALVFLLLIALSSGSLGWHYFGQRLRANYPDASGALQQTTGITCAPAAASMLLHRFGIRISEGELAELAGTNPLQGTAPYALARAVDRAARRHGMRGRIQRMDDARARRLARPFVAFVNEPGIGGHALCVLKFDPARVWVIDPLAGAQETILREEFVAEWDPVIIWVERPDG
jgi:peptidase C39-like protein